jgi:acetyltransferase-like isoleucine patch superfamily enzyme
MQLVARLPGLALFFIRRLSRRVRMYLLRPLFHQYGQNVQFDPDGFYSFDNISLGSDVSLGLRPIIMAARSKVVIGNKVMFGPCVTIIGGNHNTSVLGAAMFDITDKRPSDDLGVTIEDDVWVGSQAIILRGVVVGRGAIVAAGSIVTRSVPPYSIVAGCPACVLRFRWSVTEILEHERLAYSTEARLPEFVLRASRDQIGGSECL